MIFFVNNSSNQYLTLFWSSRHDTLDTEPVHLTADAVVIGQVLDGTDSGDDGTLVVDVLVADRLHQIGVNGL